MARPSLTVLYPGSFDPIHLGHVDVVEQAVELFGDVVVAVMHNPSKTTGMFAIGDRVDMAREATAHLGGVRVEPHTGLAVTAARAAGAAFIVKGLRTPSDFEVEQQMALTNHSVAGVRTVYLPCRPDLSFVSSRFIREMAQYGGDVDHLVPTTVAGRLRPSGDQ
jgi:pantetheine-phosphate adenylyltransferase